MENEQFDDILPPDFQQQDDDGLGQDDPTIPIGGGHGSDEGIEGGLLGLGSLISGFNLFKKAVPVRKALSPSDQAFMNQHGAKQITSMSVIRSPVQQYVDTALNVLSLGAWKNAIRKYGYDKVFHLAIIGKLSDGTEFITQKNDTVRLTAYSKSDVNSKTETQPVELTQSVSLQSLFDNAIREKADAFWVYDAFTNNCQDYCIAILGSSGLLTQKLTDFIKQDVSGIVDQIDKRNPIASKIARGITDFSARLRRLTGRGLGDAEVPRDRELPKRKFNVGRVPAGFVDAIDTVVQSFLHRYAPYLNGFDSIFIQELRSVCADIFGGNIFTKQDITEEVSSLVFDNAGEAITDSLCQQIIHFLSDVIFRESQQL